MKELKLLEKIKKWCHDESFGIDEVGVGDDCAITPFAMFQGNALLSTTDTLLENTHFFWSYFSPEDLAHKSLAVNLSDIAAMGGRPLRALVVLGVPKDVEEAFFRRFYMELVKCARLRGVLIAGGNLVVSPKWMVSLTLLGSGNENKMLCRRGALPGDTLFVTGCLGDASLGFCLLNVPGVLKGCNNVVAYELGGCEQLAALMFDNLLKERFVFCTGKNERAKWIWAISGVVSKHLRPSSREREMLVLSDKHPIRAAIDVSDGFLGDLGRLLTVSEVHASIVLEKLPISDEFQFLRERIKPEFCEFCLLRGGEDYEVVFSATNQCDEMDLNASLQEGHCRIQAFGKIEAKIKFGESSKIFTKKNDKTIVLEHESSSYEHGEKWIHREALRHMFQ